MKNNNVKIKNGKYRHFKGGLYQVIALGKHSETLEDLVLYKALYNNTTSEYWVRPIDSFLGFKIIDGKKIARFKYLGD